MKIFGGAVLFLDRSDINTDEIIPAKYLTENSKESLRPFILEDLKLPGFDPRRDTAGKGTIVTRGNFGCGSSREHAPWVLEANGINIVIGESFARIFKQNMYNCGMIAAELPVDVLDKIFSDFTGRDTEMAVDIRTGILAFKSDGIEKAVPFTLTGFERDLVESGGWVAYAASRY
jgi:3-isopropylmalate/(R)-2-methylmalate dehydratase small subunit